LNGQRLDLCYYDTQVAPAHNALTVQFSALLTIPDTTGHDHTVNITGNGFKVFDENSRPDSHSSIVIHFIIASVNGLDIPPNYGFVGSWAGKVDPRLEFLVLRQEPQIVNFTTFSESFVVDRPATKMAKSGLVDDMFNIDGELETLRLLEADARQLTAEIKARKQIVNI
jgi:hypothetical protein